MRQQCLPASARILLPAMLLLVAPASALAQWPAAQQAPAPWPAAPGQAPAQPSSPAAAPWPSQPQAPAQPMAPPSAAWPGAQPQAPAPQQSSICAQFPPLRASTEKAAAAIQAASKRKAPPPEVCPLFRTFVAAEAKMIKFLVDNKTACNVPGEAIAGAKSNHAKVTEIRDKVCAVANGPRPQAPSLADALSAPVATTTENVPTTRGGTFDTLTGNALAR